MSAELQEKPVTNLATLPPTDRAYLLLSEKHNEQVLLELAGKYVDATEIKDVTDYRMVMRGGIELQKTRVAIEKTGKDARRDANDFRTAVLAEQKRLIDIIEPEEKRLRALRKGYDDEQARIAEEARLVEQRRIADITERIQAIKRMCDGLLNADSTAIQMRLDAVDTIVCSESLFAEFTEQAAAVKASAIEKLKMFLDARVDLETQMEENARVAKEQAARQAELDRQAEEQHARDKAAKDKLDAEQAEIDRQREALEAERKAEEDKKLAAERAEAKRVQAENDRLEREARESEEAEAELVRLEALKPEADRLLAWANKIDSFDWPVITDPELTRIRQDAVDAITDATASLRRSVSDL